MDDKISEFKIYKYNNIEFDDIYDEIISLIKDNDDLSDFEETVEDAPNNVFLAFYDGFLAGVAWYTIPQDDESVVGIYVKRKYRKMSCATTLLEHINNAIFSLDNISHLTVYAFSDNGKRSSSLIDSSGFHYSHSYVTMNYSDNKLFPATDIKIINYSDEFYEQMVDLRNSGIKEAGDHYKEKTKDMFFKDDKEYRDFMKSISKNAYIIVNDGVLDGFVMIRGSEIMALNVRKEKRGCGYAIALIAKCIEHLKLRRSRYIELICVDKNIPAYTLYKKLGFKAVGRVCCYRKDYFFDRVCN